MLGHRTAGTCSALVAILSLVLATPAAAQPRDQVAAEALFVEGRRLMKAKQWSEAASKFDASDQAAPSVGARLNLGDCYRELGRTAAAWGAYRSAANLAQRNRDTRRARVADERARAMEPKLSYVVIEVPEAARIDGLEIFWDGQPRAPALWGQHFPVDPGEHTVRARAAGYESWEKTIDVTGSGKQEVTIPELPRADATTDPGDTGDTGPEPPTEPDARPPAETADPEIGGTTAGPESPEADSPGVITGGRKLAIALGAVGVVGLGAGVGFGLSARSKWDDVENIHCDEQLRCTPQGIELADEAGSHADRATVAFVVGGVAAAGAALLWFRFAPERTETGASISAVVGPDVAGLSLGGTF